jgi:hypothetical protein
MYWAMGQLVRERARARRARRRAGNRMRRSETYFTEVKFRSQMVL